MWVSFNHYTKVQFDECTNIWGSRNCALKDDNVQFHIDWHHRGPKLIGMNAWNLHVDATFTTVIHTKVNLLSASLAVWRFWSELHVPFRFHSWWKVVFLVWVAYIVLFWTWHCNAHLYSVNVWDLPLFLSRCQNVQSAYFPVRRVTIIMKLIIISIKVIIWSIYFYRFIS